MKKKYVYIAGGSHCPLEFQNPKGQFIAVPYFCLGKFPQAEPYATNAVSFPLFLGLLIEDQQRVVRALESLLV